jgi:hypothetical protein
MSGYGSQNSAGAGARTVRVRCCCPAAIAGVLFLAAGVFSQQFVPPPVHRLKITIDTTWKFYRGDITGALRADGYLGGAVVATHYARTPLTASRIVLTADPDTIIANGADFSRVVAQVVDANGTVIPTATNTITFSLSGNGNMIGQNPVAAIGGCHIILAQAGLIPGVLYVSAAAGSLTSNRVPVYMVPIPPDENWTGTAYLPEPAAAARLVRRVEKIYGSGLHRAGDAASVTVYDIRGRRLYSGPVKGGAVDLRACGITAENVYIVEKTQKKR